MKGIIGKTLVTIILLTFFAIFSTIITTHLVLSTAESPLRGIIVGILGFLPQQCSTIATPECGYCLMDVKIVPFIANVILVYTFISTFVILSYRSRGVPSIHYGVILMSIAISILTLHLGTGIIFINDTMFTLAIIFLFSTFLFHFLFEVSNLQRIYQVLLTGIIVYTVIYGTGGLLFNIMDFIVDIISTLAFRPFGFEFPHWDGITPILSNLFGLAPVDCINNVIGPEDFS